MAPEILNITLSLNSPSPTYSSNCDIWSLGLILFEIIYLYHPFSSSTSILDLYHKQKNSTIPFSPINSLNLSINPLFISLLQSMLSINPSTRLSWPSYLNSPFITNPSSNPIFISPLSKSINIVKPTNNIINNNISYSCPPSNHNYTDFIEDYIKKENDDYIIIKKDELLNSIINRQKTTTDNAYLFLHNSLKKYFSF
jgi:serine/threonine protein kinase